jgi:hypothetical protein
MQAARYSRSRCRLAPRSVRSSRAVGRQLRDHAERFIDELVDAGGGVGERQADDAGRFREHVLDGEPTTPGLPEEVDAVESESLADGRHLFDEAADLPEGGVIGDVGAAAAELIVKDHRAIVCEDLQGLEVVVARARAAVEDE